MALPSDVNLRQVRIRLARVDEEDRAVSQRQATLQEQKWKVTVQYQTPGAGEIDWRSLFPDLPRAGVA